MTPYSKSPTMERTGQPGNTSIKTMISEIIDEEVQRYEKEWKERLPIHYLVLMTIEDTAKYEQEEISEMINVLKPYWESIARQQVHSQLNEKSNDTSRNCSRGEPASKTPQLNNTQTVKGNLTVGGVR